MKKTFNVLSVIALVLTIVGALNWLCVGIFNFNFVGAITFGTLWLERALYVLVGIAGIYMIAWLILSKAKMVSDDCSAHNGYYRAKTTGGE